MTHKILDLTDRFPDKERMEALLLRAKTMSKDDHRLDVEMAARALASACHDLLCDPFDDFYRETVMDRVETVEGLLCEEFVEWDGVLHGVTPEFRRGG